MCSGTICLVDLIIYYYFGIWEKNLLWYDLFGWFEYLLLFWYLKEECALVRFVWLIWVFIIILVFERRMCSGTICLFRFDYLLLFWYLREESTLVRFVCLDLIIYYYFGIWEKNLLWYDLFGWFEYLLLFWCLREECALVRFVWLIWLFIIILVFERRMCSGTICLVDLSINYYFGI